MKKVVSVAFCTLLLCTLPLLVNVGTTMATESGYQITEAYTTTAVTVDGKYGSGEWTDAWIEFRLNATNARFAYKMDTNAGPYLMSWLLEFHDTTNDAGDRWQISIDGSADGGTAPNSNDVKFEIEGHTTLKTYVGTGTGWSASSIALTWKDNLTTSIYDSVNHYVFELQFDKGSTAWGANPPPHGLRVAMYDASNTTQGWVSWPPTPADNPSRWGLIFDYQATVPESLSLGVLVLLSSVAVVVGSFFVRKRSKLSDSPLVTMH